MFEGFVKTFIAICFFLTLVVSPIVTYIQADREASILNAQFKTSYTAFDLLLNGDTIKQYIVGQKNNVNVNVTSNL